MDEMIEYFKTMITPPVDDACVLVSTPDDLDFSAYKKEVYEEGALIPSYEPMVHGLILLGEPTEEQAKEIMDILKPGAHVVMIPEDIGYKGVIALEDTGFEVRDAIFVGEKSDSFYYTSKASRSEREAGMSAEGAGRANIHPTVKPIEIMEWCARDIDPNSKVVDPFLGSGTTGIAMSRLGHDFVGIELNPEYAKICEARIRHWMPIGTEIASEAQVGKAEPKEGEQISIFDLFD
jgi:DNA modification methylase